MSLPSTHTHTRMQYISIEIHQQQQRAEQKDKSEIDCYFYGILLYSDFVNFILPDNLLWIYRGHGMVFGPCEWHKKAQRAIKYSIQLRAQMKKKTLMNSRSLIFSRFKCAKPLKLGNCF